MYSIMSCSIFKQWGFYFFFSNLDSFTLQHQPFQWIFRIEFPGGTSCKEPTCKCRHVRDISLIPESKIPWKRARQSNSSILVWRMPWREEPGCLQSTRLQKSWSWLKQVGMHINVPFMPTFWRIFVINGCWILWKPFSVSVEMITWILSFKLLT